MQVIIQPVISLFEKFVYYIPGWHHLDKTERLDVESNAISDLVWILANWTWLLAFIWMAQKGWV